MVQTYWKGRPEKINTYAFGAYRMEVRHMANSNKAQVTMYDISRFRFPLIWSKCLDDQQANAAAQIFETVGYFDMPEEVKP